MLVFISLFGISLTSRYRYRAGAAFLTGCNAMSRVSFDSNTTLFATVEYFMSAFSCDLVKIVSVSDQNDVALHLTVSRGEDPFHLPSPPLFLSHFRFQALRPADARLFYFYSRTRTLRFALFSSALNTYLTPAGFSFFVS